MLILIITATKTRLSTYYSQSITACDIGLNSPKFNQQMVPIRCQLPVYRLVTRNSFLSTGLYYAKCNKLCFDRVKINQIDNRIIISVKSNIPIMQFCNLILYQLYQGHFHSGLVGLGRQSRRHCPHNFVPCHIGTTLVGPR